jgi:hypothetical protein
LAAIYVSSKANVCSDLWRLKIVQASLRNSNGSDCQARRVCFFWQTLITGLDGRLFVENFGNLFAVNAFVWGEGK